MSDEPNSDDVPVYDWQLKELAKRAEKLQNSPASGLSWEEVKQRVRRRAAELEAEPDIALTREELWEQVDRTDAQLPNI